MAKGKYKKKRLNKLRKEMLLQNTALPTKVVNILNGAGICTLYDLDNCSVEQLKAISGIGAVSLKQIQELKLN